jgi:hypothetical protein
MRQGWADILPSTDVDILGKKRREIGSYGDGICRDIEANGRDEEPKCTEKCSALPPFVQNISKI